MHYTRRQPILKRIPPQREAHYKEKPNSKKKNPQYLKESFPRTLAKIILKSIIILKNKRDTKQILIISNIFQMHGTMSRWCLHLAMQRIYDCTANHRRLLKTPTDHMKT